MANNTVITKLANGNVLVNTTAHEYTLNPDAQVVKNSDVVHVRNKSGSIVDTFTVEDVEKVVRDDATQTFISDVDTLFTELYTFFFFKPIAGSTPASSLIAPGGSVEFIKAPNTMAGQDGNYRFIIVSGKLHTQSLIASVWTDFAEI